jgi:hypothetical protein
MTDFNWDHCMVAVGDSLIFLAGGFMSPKFAYLYDTSTQTLSEPISMPHEHYGHSCGVITTAAGEKEVVIVGGYRFLEKDTPGSSIAVSPMGLVSPVEDTKNYPHRNVDLFSVTSMEFRQGPDFPYNVGFASLVPYGNSFAVIGGIDGDNMSDRVVTMDVEMMQWEVTDQRLETARYYHTAIPVKNAPAGTCS